MRLSEHFTLEEMTATQCRGVINDPLPDTIEVLRDTALKMEAVRALLGGPAIHVNSGYRSPLVNRMVGGSPTSAHLYGYAVDFIAPSFGTPLEVAKAISASVLAFDQLIWEEETWVHISFDPKMRQQVMTKRRHGGYVAGLRAEPTFV
jgi:zinc D-Ala-D-Ala carboxypeptidase